jgi:hypothetical protein
MYIYVYYMYIYRCISDALCMVLLPSSVFLLAEMSYSADVTPEVYKFNGIGSSASLCVLRYLTHG